MSAPLPTSPDLLQQLATPTNTSHKGQNGKVLVVGGSPTYHGAPQFAIRAALPFVDLVYAHSPSKRTMQAIRNNIPGCMARSKEQVFLFLHKIDALCVGPGLAVNDANKPFVATLLESFAGPTVIDAGASHLITPDQLLPQHILTTHPGEFTRLFNKPATLDNALPIVQKYGCIIVLKGETDIICSPQKIYQNTTGNAGMTKGGTGDILAGLTAAFASKNDPVLGAAAACWLNGATGDALKEEFSWWYTTEMVVEKLTILCEKFTSST